MEVALFSFYSGKKQKNAYKSCFCAENEADIKKSERLHWAKQLDLPAANIIGLESTKRRNGISRRYAMSSMDFETRLAVFAMEQESGPHTRAKNAVAVRKTSRARVGKAVASALSVLLAFAVTLVGLS